MEEDIRGEPDWDVIPGKTIQYKDKYITTVNTIEYYMYEIMKVDGVLRPVFTNRRQVVGNSWKVFLHDNTAMGIQQSFLDSLYLDNEFESEEDAIKAGKEAIDLD